VRGDQEEKGGNKKIGGVRMRGMRRDLYIMFGGGGVSIYMCAR